MSIVSSTVSEVKSPNVAGTFIKSAGTLALSGACLVSGLSLIAIGSCSAVYVVSKTNQFYFETPQTGFGSTGPNLGFGSGFEAVCKTVADHFEIIAGDKICGDLGSKGWKEIRGPETTTAAIGVSIVGVGGTLFISSYLVMAGFSVLGMSYKYYMDFIDTVF